MAQIWARPADWATDKDAFSLRRSSAGELHRVPGRAYVSYTV